LRKRFNTDIFGGEIKLILISQVNDFILAIFKHGQEAIAQKGQYDDRSFARTTFELDPSPLRQPIFNKESAVNRVKMLVIANSICLELIVWSAIDENGKKVHKMLTRFYS